MSTAISASRPETLVPTTTWSSAARVPVATTVRATRSSAAANTRTGRGGGAAGALSWDAVAGDSPVQPAASMSRGTMSHARDMQSIIPRIDGATVGPRSAARRSVDQGDRANRRAVRALEAQRKRHEPAARGADPVEVGQVLDDGDPGREEDVVR